MNEKKDLQIEFDSIQYSNFTHRYQTVGSKLKAESQNHHNFSNFQLKKKVQQFIDDDANFAASL